MVIEIVGNHTADKGDRGSCTLGAYSISRVLELGGGCGDSLGLWK